MMPKFLCAQALFRALKTKHETPKYGLIFHASLIGQAAPKLKGKISRSLAAKSKSDNVSGMLSYCINVSLFIEERYIKESDLLALQNNLNGNESRKSEAGNGSENDTNSSTSIEGFEPDRSNYQIGELNFVKDELNKDKPDNASNELIRGGPHLVARDSVQ